MITRTWHGWTTPENADGYAALLTNEILPGFAAKDIAGYHGASVARRDAGDEVEFVVMMWFDSIDAIRAFAGEDYDIAVVPEKARAVLKRFDERATHYETVLAPPSELGLELGN